MSEILLDILLLIGGSRGYGKDIALQAFEHWTKDTKRVNRKLHICIMGQTPPTDAFLKTLSQKNITSEFVRLDLSKPATTWLGTFEEQLNKWILFSQNEILGTLYFVQNSGVLSPTHYIMNYNVEDVENQNAINVTSFCIMTSTFLKWLYASRWNWKSVRLIQISSMAASVPLSTLACYCSGKAARNMYFRVMVEEMKAIDYFAKLDIKALSWSPGPMETAMCQELQKSENEDLVHFATVKPNFISTNESARLLWKCILHDEYPSGAMIDVFDR